jgi:phosphoserine phosphatase
MKDEIARAHKKISALGAIAAKAELSGPYQDFCAGLLALNRGLETTPGIGCEFAYPWVNQFFREMTPGELTQMASTVINEQLRVPIRELSISDTRQRWSYAWDSGIRIYREMKDLAAVFLDRGAEVVVSSASNRQLVEKMIVMTAFPCRRVIGMALPVSDGRFGAGLETGLRPNLGPGKVENIRFHIGREPVFAAGDSDNDAELLSSFASTRMRLIVGRGSGKKIAALARRALAKEAGYLWQGVDKCKGKFSDQRDATDQLF